MFKSTTVTLRSDAKVLSVKKQKQQKSKLKAIGPDNFCRKTSILFATVTAHHYKAARLALNLRWWHDQTDKLIKVDVNDIIVVFADRRLPARSLLHFLGYKSTIQLSVRLMIADSWLAVCSRCLSRKRGI